MFFLGLIIIGTLVATALDRLGFLSMPEWRDRLRAGLSTGLVFVGIDHLVTPDRYVPMIEAFLPYPRAIVAFTGICEIAGAIGLIVPSLRRLAGTMLAIYFVSVFPANISNALQSVSIDGLPDSSQYYWFRLALQPVFIGLALYVSHQTNEHYPTRKQTILPHAGVKAVPKWWPPSVPLRGTSAEMDHRSSSRISKPDDTLPAPNPTKEFDDGPSGKDPF